MVEKNAATETLKEKVAIRFSDMQTGEKEEVDQRGKKLKKTVFIVWDSMIKKFKVTKSINHKFLTKVRPFKAAKTTDI